MVPNSYIHEQLVHERIQKWHREAEQARVLARLPRFRSRGVGSLLGGLGAFFVAVGTSLQQLELQNQRLVSTGTRDRASSMKGHELNPTIGTGEQLPSIQVEASAARSQVLA
jgi:hypothetical protein